MSKRTNAVVPFIGAMLVVLGTTMPLVSLGVIGAVLAIVVCWRNPRRAFTLWILSLLFVPVWVATSGVAAIPISSLIALLAIVCVGARPVRWSSIDVIPILIAILAGIATAFAGSPAGEMVNILSLWISSYFAARVLTSHLGAREVGSIFARAMSVVAALALVEFFTGWHPYVDISMPNLLYQIWSPIQIRGGVERSEWAFGHSIALGAAFALALPFALTMKGRTATKVLSTCALFGGVAVTFSRSALLSMILSTLLIILFSRSVTRRMRSSVAALSILAAVVIAPAVFAVFTTAGDEVTNSGAYRGDLLSTIPLMDWIGISPVVQVASTGFRSYGRFVSIDSALIAVGLDFGLILALILVTLYAVPLLRTLTRRASVAEIALAGQLPLILTVAFITQWQALLWLVAGIAVSSHHKSSARRNQLAAFPAPHSAVKHTGAT